MKFYVAGADDARFYMIRRKNLNLMFSAGHFWSSNKFKEPTVSIPYDSLFLDSGAFQLFGRFKDFPFTLKQYIDFVNKLKPHFFATMDYPCEPFMRKKMGFSVKDCILKTVENTRKLVDIPTNSTLIPVVQGWNESDYLECIDLFKAYGLIKNYMGIGTLCRRGRTQRIKSILRIVRKNVSSNVQLHGFGVKISMLKIKETYNLIQSCDSAAWVSHVRGGEIVVFTGRKLITIPYRELPIDAYERLSISFANYLSYVEYLISKYSQPTDSLLSEFVIKNER